MSIGLSQGSSGLRHAFPKMERVAFLSVGARMDSEVGSLELEFPESAYKAVQDMAIGMHSCRLLLFPG